MIMFGLRVVVSNLRINLVMESDNLKKVRLLNEKDGLFTPLTINRNKLFV